MPRFYFHLYNDVDAPDEEGREMPDLATAHAYTVHLVRFTAAETIKDEGHFVLDHRIEIEDEHGTVLDTVYFKDAVKIEG
ncbi:hypothetical protein [Sphingomonas sp.]|uniref:DUF6894 family protein n=1 Tax=Sphingomonas sp. TaxID=28214 RepID=UPI001813D5F1|nr:hypothetical protein [Sphingomonas sp.]MBA3512332.1 hypothetical protein [Sphingomonas sp.]